MSVQMHNVCMGTLRKIHESMVLFFFSYVSLAWVHKDTVFVKLKWNIQKYCKLQIIVTLVVECWDLSMDLSISRNKWSISFKKR